MKATDKPKGIANPHTQPRRIANPPERVINIRARRKFFCMFCLVLFPFLTFAQVEDFTKRLDELTKTVVVPQTEQLLRSHDSILSQDSVQFFPLFLFRQNISNMDKEKYLDYSFLNGLQWTALVPDKSIYPFELMVGDLEGNIKYVFMHANRLKKNSWYSEFFDSNGDEVLKKLLVKLLYNRSFDYAFVTSVPVIEERTNSIHQQGRDGMCFCIKNGQVYVLFRDCQLLTMEEFVKRYWDWFDVKTSDTYAGQSTEEAPCTTKPDDLSFSSVATDSSSIVDNTDTHAQWMEREQKRIDSLLSAYELTLVTETERDSIYCVPLMPKIAFDGTQYTEGIVFRSPRAKLKDESLGSIQSRVSDYYHDCLEEMGQDNKASVLTSVFLIVDERGCLRGLYFDLEKEQKELELLLARKIFRKFKDEMFCPAVDLETGDFVSDIIEISFK